MTFDPPAISVIIPALNEAGLIGALLRHLRLVEGNLEIIVVDGGSTDGTPSIAKAAGAQVISAPRGRASQMNAGAAIARGEILWFLHADLTPPENALREIRASLAEPRVVGGCFRLSYPRPELIYRVSDSLGNIGVTVFGFALGDHGIFCRRSAFFRASGYPDLPILEDAELYKRLRRYGRTIQLRDTIVSSPRTFENCGRYRTTAAYSLILLLYVAGVPLSLLNRIYRRFHSRTAEAPMAASASVPSAREPRSQVVLGNSY